MAMKKSYLIAFFAVLAIIVWSASFVLAKGFFAYNYNVNGMLVQSDFADPKTYFAELGNAENFVVSPAMHEIVSSEDQYVFSAATTFSVVLNGNGKNTVLLIRVFGENNELSHCFSNFGDVMASEKLSKEDCLKELDSGEKTRIFVEPPNALAPNAFVLLEKDKITIRTGNYKQLGMAALLVSSIMYENSMDIIAKSNELIGRALSDSQ